MKIGEACAIFDNIETDEYTDEEKGRATGRGRGDLPVWILGGGV